MNPHGDSNIYYTGASQEEMGGQMTDGVSDFKKLIL